jgi:hypothetical protein
MTQNRRRFLALALAVSALLGLASKEAWAAPISMNIYLGGGPPVLGVNFFDVDLVAMATPQGYTVDAAGLTAVNAFLAGAGSQYRFGTLAGATSNLGGSSNFPGATLQGQLTLTGEIHSVGAGNSFLELTQFETDFTSPVGPFGTLFSSSTGNFTNQPAGGGHTAHSLFNAIATPTYTVLSSATTPNPGINGGPVSTAVAPVSTFYTLTNKIVFGLSAPGGTNSIVDSFGVTATITAIPEPSSVVLLVTSMPLPLMVIALLRRHRRAAA